jgi:hypothetical protein
MKKLIPLLLLAQMLWLIPGRLSAQADPASQEFGITTGGLTNFPADKNYLKKNMSMLYVAPYIRVGKHEFSAGVIYPLTVHGLYFNDENINPRVGVTAGYKFYLFNIYGAENMFIHYMFQYIRFNGNYDTYGNNGQVFHWTETDMYINNVIGVGYNLFFDPGRRFGLYYTLDYVISQTGYKLGTPAYSDDSWTTRYVWNNLSTHIGLVFKICPLAGKKGEVK